MRKFFLLLIAALFSQSAFAELRYIEIGSKQNLPMIRIKKIEDFEAIIKTYDISLIFLQYESDSKSSFYSYSTPKPTEAFVIAGNTYFLFAMEGYQTLTDYKAGKTANFKTSADYEKAKSLGIDNSEFFYFYSNNSFSSISDCKDAQKNKFTSSTDYYDAKKLGYSNYIDYKEYLDYTRNGFSTKDEYLLAKSKGFFTAEGFKTATEAGFIDNQEYKAATALGLKTKSDFTNYNEITTAIDKIISEKKIEKKNAITYYFVQNLPKGESSLPVVSRTLKGVYNANSTELKSALSRYVNDAKNQRDLEQQKQDRHNRTKIIDIQNLLSEDSLKNFFITIDIKQLGSYSSQSEIFKKK